MSQLGLKPIKPKRQAELVILLVIKYRITKSPATYIENASNSESSASTAIPDVSFWEPRFLYDSVSGARIATPPTIPCFLAVKGMQRLCSLSVSRSFRALVAPRFLNYPAQSLKRSSVRMENSNFSSGLSANPRGALIVLEGLDRSGKSTQCAKLHSFLEGLGHPTELWRFPDRETNVGQMISAYLSNKSQLDDHTIHLLFSANRWEKRSLMEEKLKTGTTLIVDRYSYSGVAFSSAKGLGIDWCKAPEIGLLAPDAVLYLDISPERAAERGGYGDERYERVEFQKKVAEFYQTLRDSSWKIINAGEAMEEVEKNIQQVVLDKIKECAIGKPLSLLWSA